MSDFWKDFTYCVKIECHDADTKQIEFCYVTEVDNSDKTFKYATLEDIKAKGLEIQVFHLTKAVDLMNAMTCNGYKASIEPYFKN